MPGKRKATENYVVTARRWVWPGLVGTNKDAQLYSGDNMKL